LNRRVILKDDFVRIGSYEIFEVVVYVLSSS